MSAPSSVSQTWIEVRQHPTLGRVGETVQPNPVVALWSDRSAVDAFGLPLPTRQLYDSLAPGVLVNVSLFGVDGERLDHNLIGTRPVAVKCGFATFTDLEVNRLGNFRLRFDATYLGTVPAFNSSMAFQVLFGVATSLALNTEPDGARASYVFQQQPVAHILDVGANLVYDSSLAVTVTVVGELTFLSNEGSVAVAVRGVARFDQLLCQTCAGPSNTGLAIATPITKATLLFTAAGIASTTSREFDVASWPPDSLAIRTTPVGRIPAVAPLSINPVVELRDVSELLVSYESSATMVVRATLRQRVGVPDTLRGTMQVPLVRGVATFTDLALDHVQGSYILDFLFISSLSGVTGVSSNNFDLIPGTASRLGFASIRGEVMKNGTLPSGPAPGFPMATQPAVLVLDGAGNWNYHAAVHVTASLLAASPGGAGRVEVSGGAAFELSRTAYSCPWIGDQFLCTVCASTTECGVARFQALQLDRNGSALSLRFDAAGLASVETPLFAVREGAPHRLVIAAPPLGFKANTPVRAQPTVAVHDRGDNVVVGGAPVGVTALLCRSTTRSCSVGGTAAAPTPLYLTAAPLLTSAGQAIYTDLHLPIVGEGFLLSFCATDPSVACVNTSSFDVSEDPLKLVVKQQPGGAVPGVLLATMPRVDVVDVSTITSGWAPRSALAVTASLCQSLSVGPNGTVENPDEEQWNCLIYTPPTVTLRKLGCLAAPVEPPQLLAGGYVAAATEGVAAFSNLRVDREGRYILRFSSGGLGMADSSPFEVHLGPAGKLAIVQDLGEEAPGLPFPIQPAVAVQDVGGNTVLSDLATMVTASLVGEEVTGDGGVVRRDIGEAPMHFAGQPSWVQVRYGVAWFQGLRLDNASLVWTLTFTSTPPLLPVSSRPVQLKVGSIVGFDVLVRPAGCFAEVRGGVSAGRACTSQPVVAAIDRGGNVVAAFNDTVNASVTQELPGGGESKTLAWLEQDAVAGVASFAGFTISTTGSGYIVRFTSALISTAITGVAVSSSGTRLMLVQEPKSFVPGAVARVQPWVAVEDVAGRHVDSAFGVLIRAVVLPPEIDFRPNPGAPIPVAGTLKVATVAGVTRFTNLRIDAPGRCFIISLVPPPGSAIASVLSLPFNIEKGKKHEVVVTQEPAGVVPGVLFVVQPKIAMTDLGGNVIEEDSDTIVTAQIFQQSSTALKGTGRSLSLINGKTSFSGLWVNLAADCMQLEFRAVGRITGYSKPFNVLPLSPVKLGILTGALPGEATPGMPLGMQPRVVVLDTFANKVFGGDIFVTATLLAGGVVVDCTFLPWLASQCLQGTITAKVEQVGEFRGVALFTDLQINLQNNFYSILFTAQSLAPVESARTLTLVPGSIVAGLRVLLQPDGFAPGRVILHQPQVGLVDPGGNVVVSAPSASVDVSMTKEGQVPHSGVILSGALKAVALGGLSNFTDLALDRFERFSGDDSLNATTRLTLTFSATVFGFGTVESRVFDLPSPLVSLRLEHQPRSVTAGHNIIAGVPVGGGMFVERLVVRALDALGREVTLLAFAGANATDKLDTVRVALAGDADASLLIAEEGSSASFRDGVATFRSLSINQAGVYTLVFSAGNVSQGNASVTVLSREFNITNGPPFVLQLSWTPEAAWFEAGLPIAVQPILTVLDQYGNLVLDQKVLVSVTVFLDGEPLPDDKLIGDRAVSSHNGQVNFNTSGLGIMQVGANYRIRFESPNLPSLTSNTFSVPPGQPVRMRLLNIPSQFSAGEPMYLQPTVRLEDQGENLIANADNVTVQLFSVNASGSGCGYSSQGSRDFFLGSTQVPCGAVPPSAAACPYCRDGLKIQQPFCAPENVLARAGAICYAIVSRNGSNGVLPFVFDDGTAYDVEYAMTTGITLAMVAAREEAIHHNGTTTVWRLAVAFSNTIKANGSTVSLDCAGQIEPALDFNTSFGSVEACTQGDYFCQENLRDVMAPNYTISGFEWNASSAAILSHECVKYNFTVPFTTGLAVFAGLVAQAQAEGMKLRFTLQSANPTFHRKILLETGSFDVPGLPTRVAALRVPSIRVQGGTPFPTQPTLEIVDSGGRRATLDRDITVTAILRTVRGQTGSCPPGQPYSCLSQSIHTDVCAIGVSFCPTLRGTLQLRHVLGVVAFTDLAITTCNDRTVESDLCMYADYYLDFSASVTLAGATSPLTLTTHTTPPIAVDIGPAASIGIGIVPVGGNAAGTPLARQPGLVVSDAGGNRVLAPPVTVSASLTHVNASEAALLTPADLAGRRDVLSLKGAVIYTDLTPLRSGLELTLRFDIPGFASVLSATQLLVRPAAPVALRILQQPAGSIGGLAFDHQPRIDLLDVYGNRVTANPRVVAVAITTTQQTFPGNLSANGGILTESGALRYVGQPGELSLTTKEGVAAFRQLTIDKVAACYTLTFTSTGLRSATSASFDVSFGPAFKIVLSIEPTGVAPGRVLETSPEVRVTDVGGNLISLNDDRINVLCNIPTGENTTRSVGIYGTLELRAQAGIARFTDLLVREAVEGLVFVFSRSAGGMLDVTSRTLLVSVGAGQALVMLTEPSGPVPGFPLGTQPRVEVQDAGGNRVTAGTHLVTASLMQAGLPRLDVLLRGPLCDAFQCLNQCGTNVTCPDPKLHCPTCVSFSAALGHDPVLSVASTSGVASFASLALELAGDDYWIRFSSHLLIFTESTLPLSVVPGVAFRLYYLVPPAGFLASVPLLVQPTAELRDVGSNRIPNSLSRVTITLHQPPGGTALLLPAESSVVAMVDGVAAFLGLRVNTPGQGFQLEISSGACAPNACLSAFTPPFTVSSIGTRIIASTSPASSVSGGVLIPQPVVSLIDATGRVVTWESSRLVVAASIHAPDNGKNASLLGALTAVCCAGVCEFTDLRIDRAQQRYRLEMRAPPFAPTLTNFFDTIGPSRLTVSREPVGFLTGEALEMQPSVTILDDLLRLASTNAFTVTASIAPGSGSGSARIVGNPSAKVVQGVATFTDVGIAGIGSGFVLRFTAAYLTPAESAPFDVDSPGRLNAEFCGVGSQKSCGPVR